jgi:hypothetical protein
VSGGMSGKLLCVLAAAAFVGAFRVQLSTDDAATPASAAVPAGQGRPSAADLARTTALAPPRLSRVPALPALRRAPVRRHARRAPVRAIAVAAATSTPAPHTFTTAARPTTPPPSKPRSYVGRSFDTSG